jgi:glycerol uptake facilitator-like aquaporin
MATKKPKTSAKSTKTTKSTKPKTAAKPVTSVAASAKTKTVEKTENTEKAKKSCFKGFFSKKYEEKESIMTVFKSHKFYGALLGELLGTGLLTLLLFSLSFASLANIATFGLALVAILVGVYAFSGACLNPIVTVGMMASRRMSVIRGIMYIIAEIVGAWLGWLIFNAFHVAGGEEAAAVPTLVTVGENQFWLFAMVELLGAVVIAFTFARALKYKRSVFTFAVTATGGVILAILVGYMISAALLGLDKNFIFNPAVALMFKIFPTSGEGFGEILGGVCQALSIYALLPMIGGVVGFYLSDFMGKLSSEE